MTAACITLDQIESRTATNLALANYGRRVRYGIISVTFGKLLLSVLVHRLNQLKKQLQSGFLERLNEQQLQEFSGLLKQLICSLIRLSTNSRMSSHQSLNPSIQAIQDSIEDFESILENIYLTLDPGFHKAVSSAIDGLSLGVEDRAILLR